MTSNKSPPISTSSRSRLPSLPESPPRAISPPTITIKSAPQDEVFIFMDTETTGVGANDEIIEISMIRVARKDFAKVEKMAFPQLTLRFRPTRPVSRSAQVVHQVSSEVLSNCASFADCVPAIMSFINQSKGQPTIIVTHNCPFDRRMFVTALERTGHTEPQWLRWACTLQMVRKFSKEGILAEFPELKGKRNNLGNIFFNLFSTEMQTKAEGSLGDVIATIFIVKALSDGADEICKPLNCLQWLVDNSLGPKAALSPTLSHPSAPSTTSSSPAISPTLVPPSQSPPRTHISENSNGSPGRPMKSTVGPPLPSNSNLPPYSLAAPKSFPLPINGDSKMNTASKNSPQPPENNSPYSEHHHRLSFSPPSFSPPTTATNLPQSLTGSSARGRWDSVRSLPDIETLRLEQRNILNNFNGNSVALSASIDGSLATFRSVGLPSSSNARIIGAPTQREPQTTPAQAGIINRTVNHQLPQPYGGQGQFGPTTPGHFAQPQYQTPQAQPPVSQPMPQQQYQHPVYQPQLQVPSQPRPAFPQQPHPSQPHPAYNPQPLPAFQPQPPQYQLQHPNGPYYGPQNGVAPSNQGFGPSHPGMTHATPAGPQMRYPQQPSPQLRPHPQFQQLQQFQTMVQNPTGMYPATPQNFQRPQHTPQSHQMTPQGSQRQY